VLVRGRAGARPPRSSAAAGEMPYPCSLTAKWINVLGDEWSSENETPGYRWRRMRIADRNLGASLYQLAPGQRTFPYHYEVGKDELLLVVEGTPTLR